MGNREDFYAALGVPFEATEEDIRRAYHRLARTLHPDRSGGEGGGRALEHFHQVQNAWRVLSDPTRRLLYDLRNFGRSSPGGVQMDQDEGNLAAETKLIQLQKEQAVLDISNMDVQLQKVLRREKAARGVLVMKALYGDLRLSDASFEDCMAGRRTIEKEDLIGPLVDVCVPLQCLVEKHSIMLPGGASMSKADLPGFYNPAPLRPDVELSLYVLYEFRGKLHEVIVGDRETLSLPFRRHAIPTGQTPRGPFSPANFEMMKGAEQQDSAGRALSAASGKALEKAFERAVESYRVRRLRPPVCAKGEGPSEEEPTRGEFATVAGMALTAFALAWAAGGHRAGC